jgi:predicted RNase H-like HicB family nuclease
MRGCDAGKSTDENEFAMLTDYISAAMRRATYDLLPDDEGYYGEITLLPGVYANARNLDACRSELQSVLEGWIMLGLAMGHPFPEIDGSHLIIHRNAA